MAISLKDIYAYITGASAAYPWGSFKNATGSGTLDGTPFEKQWANDVYGFLQRLLSVAGATPSGAPDTAEVSQYFDAIESIMWQPGDTKFCMYSTPGRRWLEMNGNTVGNAASGASARANADTLGLFSILWNLAPASAAMYESGGGLVAVRGASAAADFAANRKIAIPDMRGVVPRGWDHGRGLDAGRVLGSYQADAQQNITGGFPVDDTQINMGSGAFYNAGASPAVAMSNDSSTGGKLGFDASRQVRVAEEVRVKSIAGMWEIRY